MKPRLLAGGALLCAAWGTFAQTQPSTERSSSDPVEINLALEQSRLRKERLRQALADPLQRAGIRAERIRQERTDRPDLARVLRLDTRTEQRLFDVLCDHRLAFELQPDVAPSLLEVPPPGSNSRVKEAREYTQRMRDIGRILAAEQFDAYVDYMLTRAQRLRVERLDSALSASTRLTAKQKDALVTLFHEHALRNAVPLPLQLYEATSTVQLSLIDEAMLLNSERAFLELVDQATPLLTPVQAGVFAEQQQVFVKRWRTERQRSRLARRAAPDEPLPPRVPPPLKDPVQLRIEIDVNGIKRSVTLSNGRSSTLSFEGPDGLWVQAKPYASYRGAMLLELSFFEPRSTGRRLLGQSYLSNTIDVAGQGPTIFSGGSSQLLEGRKGYGVVWNYEATYQ